MLNKLFVKLSLALLLVFLGLGIVLVRTFDNATLAMQRETTQQLHAELASHISHEIDFWHEGQLDMEAIEHALHLMMVLGPANDLYVLSPQGVILAHASDERDVIRDAVDTGPLVNVLNGAANLPVMGDDPKGLDEGKIFSVSRLYVPGEAEEPANMLGYLYIILGGQSYDNTRAAVMPSHIAGITSTSMIAAVTFFLMVALTLFFVLTKPVNELSAYLQEFRDKQFMKLPERSLSLSGKESNELARLASVLKEMSEKIVSQFDEMIESKKHRQELVAHISHDLRTPLAGVKGYLETWKLKEGELSEEERSKYIDTAMKHCEQLSKLVDELFVLARLEGNEIKLNREQFPLDELVSDLVQRMQLLAKQNNVGLQFEADQQMPFVDGDIAQIDRVFSNLIENGIRHTPEGGEVRVQLSNQRGEDGKPTISVTISDNGDGIAEDQLNRLFDPYFRGANQNKQYPKGTGLGLAITKRLLELHDAAISVSSQLGKGSVFQFKLPVAGET